VGIFEEQITTKNMKTVFLILVSTILTHAALAECDCTIVPFQPNPPCFQQCVSKILSKATYSELTGIFKLPEDVSKKIISLREQGGTSSSDWYKKALSASEISHIDTAFKNVSQYAVDKFEAKRETTTTTTTTEQPR
jgi:hypothetical protein